MSQQQPEDNLINSDRSVAQLAWAIENSVGQFKLILARCNYSKLRDRLIARLQEICQVEIQVLVVQQSHRTLFTAIQETFGENISGCVMVVGLEAVQDLSQMLTAANQVREEFRKHFNFPLVVWIDDAIYQQLIQVAPDLESWAITKSFDINQQELTDFIITIAHKWFNNQLNLNFYEYLKLETELTAAQKELINEENPSPNLSPKSREAFPVPPSLLGKGVRGLGQYPNLEINAFIESLLGLTKQINNQKDAAIQHYQTALTLWQQNNNLEWQIKILGEKAFCAYLEAIKQQDKEHLAWQATRQYIAEYIQLSTQINRPDIIANSLNKLGDILQELELLQQLKTFAEQSLSIHQTNNRLRELARDYGFLAEVALAEEDWKQAIYLVKQALEIIPTIPSQSLDHRLAKSVQTYDLNLYKFILSRAQYRLGNTQDAIHNLETAKDGANPQEDVRLYIDILNQLQQFYFEQKQYLKAYNIKQQRRSIEQQFGLRAFVGAGRLEASRQTFVETLYTTSNISPEISASGRQLDVERLVERLNNDDYKLIVIHGQSGVGKSSLVNAGLVPALQQQSIRAKDNLVIVMRVYTNWVEELGRLLEAGSRGQGAGSREQESRGIKRDSSTAEVHSSSSEVHSSASEPKDSCFEHQTPSSELESSHLELESSHLEPESSHLEPESSHLEPEHSHLEPEHSHLEPEHSHSNLNSFASPLLPCSPAPLLPHSLLNSLREKEQRNLRTVLVFDQFEEFFFVYTEPAQRQQFFEFLGSCLEVLSAKVILSLRVDYIHYLLECNDLPNFQIIANDILSNNVLYKLGNFSPDDTKSIIQRLTANTSFRLEPALVDAMVDDLAGDFGEVRPIELQVVGAQLQAENITTLEKYRQFGTKQDLVQHYLNEVVYDCGEENQQLAEIVLFLLTDERGTRPLKTRVELERDLQQYFSASDVESGEIPPTPLKKGGKFWQFSPTSLTKWSNVLKVPLFKGDLGGSDDLCIDNLDLVLDIFVKSGLVVLLPENPTDRYQLVHDYLANFIHQQQEPKLKQVMAELQKEREQRKQSEAKLNKFLKRALFGSVAAGIGMAILTTLAVRSADDAQREKQNAEANEINALNNSSEAFFVSDKHRDALIEALRASKKLNGTVWKQEKSDTRIRTVTTLRQAVYLKLNEKKENRAIEVNTLEGHSNLVNSVAYHPDGKQLASASADKTIKIWDISTGKTLQTLSGHSNWVNSIAYSPDGQQLASASWDKTIKIWDISTGQPLRTLSGHSSPVISIAYSPDKQQLASASIDSTIKIWDISTGKLLTTLSGHSSSVYSVTYSPDGQHLASASADNTIKIWNISTGKPLQTLSGHDDSVISIVYSPDGQHLASASWDKTIKIWDISTGKPLKTLSGHSNSVISIVYSPDGKQLASASDDKTIKIWDISTGKPLKTLSGYSNWINSIVYSPDGKQLASVSDDRTIKIWDIGTGKPLQTLSGHTDWVNSVAYSPNGQQLASASGDKTIKIWDISRGRVLKNLSGHSSWINNVTYSPNGQQLASASGDKTIKIWDISTGKATKTFSGHTDSVISVAYSLNGEQLASASGDKTIKIWDISTGKPLKTFSGHTDKVYSVAYSPDGEQLASASGDKTIKIWDIHTGKPLKTFSGHNNSVISVVYSPDGKQLASASFDKTIKIWDISTGEPLKNFSGHRDSVYNIAYSPDGKQLASASFDNTIKIWDISTGKPLKTLSDHSSRVISVAYSPDSKQLASASWDKTVILWDLDFDNLLRSGCDLLNNYLIAHPVVLEELSSCQTPARLVPAATVLVIQGEKLARVGDVKGAVAKFRTAQQWDKSLKFDPEAKAREL
ncbi:ribosome assembly protein 4 [Anabaena minutissima FACHB-250]|nr:ribosome assembly protein 4 [Anabaena minutissima FACHB-250]